jgi:hypothetical protein
MNKYNGGMIIRRGKLEKAEEKPVPVLVHHHESQMKPPEIEPKNLQSPTKLWHGQN